MNIFVKQVMMEKETNKNNKTLHYKKNTIFLRIFLQILSTLFADFLLSVDFFAENFSQVFHP